MLRLPGSKRLRIIASILLIAMAVWVLSQPAGPPEPIYQGRPLGVWLRMHPRDYFPAVLAVGTNALPYLLDELQAIDSPPARFGKKLLAKVSMGPFWRDASNRRYHAGLALQILDTNAAPYIMDVILGKPIRLEDGDPGLAALGGLQWLSSSNSQLYFEARLSEALTNSNWEKRWNATIAFNNLARPSDESFASVLNLTRDTNYLVRVGAMLVLIQKPPQTNSATIEVLIAHLNDDQALVRKLAALALHVQGTKAIEAIPALQAAYVAEPTRTGPRSHIGMQLPFDADLSPNAVRDEIGRAIMGIDPSGHVPR